MKILVIDDEEDIQLLFNYKFKKEIMTGEVKFFFALSAFEALNLLANQDLQDIALIISDIRMPGMNGLELLQIIRKRLPDIKFFVISAYMDKKETALKNGADDFFSKPIDFDLLRDKIIELQEEMGP